MKRIVLAALVVCLALVALAPSASGGAPKCSNLTVSAGPSVGKLTVRLGLLGHVSCATAQRVVKRYFKRLNAGQCGELNNFCALTFPDGWSCSIFPAALEKSLGGAFVGCATSDTTKVRVFKAKRKTGTLHLAQFLSPDQQVWCVLGSPLSFCASGAPADPPLPQYSARLKRGKVTTCFVAKPSLDASCVQNWNPEAKILRAGRRTQVDGVRCTASKTAITCKLVKGAHKGKGFSISATGVAKLG